MYALFEHDLSLRKAFAFFPRYDIFPTLILCHFVFAMVGIKKFSILGIFNFALSCVHFRV